MRLKSLERRWRSLCLRAISRLMPRDNSGGPPDWASRPHRVLFLRPDRIGDMILSTGVIRAIATSHRTIALDVLASPANAAVLRAEPSIHAVVPFDKGRLWGYANVAARLRRARYDAVIDCMVTAPSVTTLLLMLASGARHRIGVAGRGADFALTLPVPPRATARHLVDQLAALALPFGVDMDATDWRPVIVLTDAERSAAEERWGALAGGPGRRLLANLSAGKAARRWPDDRFVEVLLHLRRRYPDLRLLTIGAPGEAARAQRIAARAGVAYAATPALRAALALVAAADFVFTPDTSIAHAASAFGKPEVALYLRDVATAWGPYRTPGHALASPDKSLASLPLAPVLAALDDLLRVSGIPTSVAVEPDVARADARHRPRLTDTERHMPP